MIESLAKSLAALNLEPDAFISSSPDERIFRGEVQPGKVINTWANLAKAAAETKYWPIIQGGSDKNLELPERDPAEILSMAPIGGIREILKPRLQQRIESFREMPSEIFSDPGAILLKLDADSDMDTAAAAADAAGIYSFIGRSPEKQDWPADPADRSRVKFHTLQERKGQPSTLLLIRVEHTYEVPAYLQFGGWNDCPEPELQVAVFREWQLEHKAVPACITGDVVEFFVKNRPQTEIESMKIAAEQWVYCEDIVGQGTQSIRKLAIEIWQSPTWFFWWD